MASFTESFDLADGTVITTANTAYDNVAITGLTVVAETALAKVGSASLRRSGTGTLSLGDFFAASTPTHYRRFYLYLRSSPSAFTPLYAARNVADSAFAFDVRISTSRTLQLRNSSLAAQATTTTALPLDEWCRVEVGYSSGTLTVRVYVGAAVDAAVGSYTEQVTATYATTDVGRVLLGGTASATWDVNIDDDRGEDTDWVGPAGSPPSSQNLGQSTATESALPVAEVKSRAVGQAVETVTGRPVGRTKTRAVATAVGTDTARPVAAVKSVGVGQPVETDTAPHLAVSRVLGVAVEGDAAPGGGAYPGEVYPGEAYPGGGRNLTAAKHRLIGQAVEVDSASVVEAITLLHVAAETDSATPVTAVKTANAGAATATESAPAVAAVKTSAAGVGVSAESAGALSAGKVRALDSPAVGEFAALLDRTKTVELGQAVDTHTTNPVTPVKTAPLGGVVETSAAAPLARQRLIGQPVEFDEATTLGTIGPVVVGPAVSGESARPVTAVKRSVLGRATDTHSATAMANSLNQVDAGVETDSARPVVGVKTTVLGVAVETTTVSVLEQVKSVLLGAGVELDGAFELIGAAPVVALGQAVEWESGLPLLTGSAAVDGWPPSVSGPFWDPLLVVSAP